MLNIYHYPLCPFSRKLRILLSEKKIDFTLILEKYWERRNSFLEMSPSGATPVIEFQESGMKISGTSAMFEFLEEKFPEVSLLPTDIFERFEIRRLVEWFDVKFYNEVSKYIINERVIKPVMSRYHLEPNSSIIRAAKKNLVGHMDYIEYMLKNTQYLCGDKITLADYSAAAQISVLDFTGDILWNTRPKTREWYAIIKSRPSFRPLLEDRVPGLIPPDHYSDPDF